MHYYFNFDTDIITSPLPVSFSEMSILLAIHQGPFRYTYLTRSDGVELVYGLKVVPDHVVLHLLDPVLQHK